MILSLGNQSTLVGDVAAVLSDFIAAWVTTNAELDSLVARTMPSSWTRSHLPVFSTPKGHTLYIGRNVLEPEGKLIRCPVDCGQPFYVEHGKSAMKVICPGCQMNCSLPKVVPKSGDWLTEVGILKTEYPRQNASIEWKKREEKKDQQPTNPPSPVSSAALEFTHSERSWRSRTSSIALESGSHSAYPSPSPLASIPPSSAHNTESSREPSASPLFDCEMEDLLNQVQMIPFEPLPDVDHLAPPPMEQHSTSLPNEESTNGDLRARVRAYGRIWMPSGSQIWSRSAPDQVEQAEASTSSREPQKRETPSRLSGSKLKRRKQA